MTPSERDRVRALATQAAYRAHCYGVKWGERAHDFNGNLPDNGFATCPHPDCVLLRSFGDELSARKDTV